MMKKTLLMVAGATSILLSQKVCAQTDVTSLYLTNPSFEILKSADNSKDIGVKLPLADGLYGWKLSVDGISNYQLESENSGSDTGFPASGTKKIKPSDGTYYYFNRKGWGNLNSTISTTTKDALPVGTYYLEFDYKAADYSNNNNAATNGTSMGIVIAGAAGETLTESVQAKRAYSIANSGSNAGTDTYMINAPWTKMGTMFQVNAEGPVTITIKQNMLNNGRSDIMLDNFRLYALDNVSQTTPLNITGALANPGFEARNANGWAFTAANDTKAYANSGSYAMTECTGYLFNTWSSAVSNLNIKQTVKNLPAGKYQVKAVMAGWDTTNDITLSLGGQKTTITGQGQGIGLPISSPVYACVGGDVEVVASATQFFKLDDVQLFYLGELSDADKLPAAKVLLKNQLERVENMNTDNVGNGLFQIPNAAYEDLTNNYTAADNVYNSAAATLAQVNAMTENLKEAIEAYNATEYNAPLSSVAYNLILKDNNAWTYDGRAITWLANDRADAGFYNMQYKYAPGANYAQSFYFEKVDGLHCFRLKFIDADNQSRYISTGTLYGGTGNQIRTTLEADKALTFKIEPMGNDIFKLYNTEVNTYLGGQDAGVFTVNSHNNFTFVEADKAQVVLDVKADYATLILPFEAQVPAGLNVYSCTSVQTNGTTLDLIAADKLQANKPYIVEDATPNDKSDNTFTFEGIGTASKDSYTEGLLTGVFIEKTASVGTYVLQNGTSGIGFYAVAENAQPMIPIYRAYLVTSGNAKMFAFDNGTVTGVDDLITTDADALVDVYTLSGSLIRSSVKKSKALQGLAKGLYLVGGEKKSVK